MDAVGGEGALLAELLRDEPGKRLLLLGNEAIVRGALEAGVGVATTYPGTPASEIGDNFSRIARDAGMYFEYSVNEKVALEVAAGAALSGVRSICSMKHLGLNVAADPVPTLGYVGMTGGFVIVTAGDPGCHTSPNEQDHRYLAKMWRLPMLDPAFPEEARQMAAAAFELSEKYEVPVLLRPTTRVSHTRGVVNLGELPGERSTQGRLIRDPMRYVPVPANARRLEQRLIEALQGVAADAEQSPFNRIRGQGPLGVVVSGVSAGYVRDALTDLDMKHVEVTMLKLGLVHPLPHRLIREFLQRVERVLVVEELEPYLETEIRAAAAGLDKTIEICGKSTGHLPLAGEYGPCTVRAAVARYLGRDDNVRRPVSVSVPELPVRPPVLCAGCPHRATYYAVKLAAEQDSTVYMNDIGCYTLGVGPPLDMADFLICMGSSITKASGMSRTLAGKQAVAFIGDSTFFHSGITGLVNAVYNGHDLLVVVVDNGTTGMTGSQPNPGTGLTGMGLQNPKASIEGIARACGVRQVTVVDPSDLAATYRAAEDALDASGVRVLVSRHPCPVFVARRDKTPIKQGTYAVDFNRCNRCGNEAEGLHCGLSTSREHALHRSRTRVRYEGQKPVPALPPEGGDQGVVEEPLAAARPQDRPPEPAPCSAACPVGLCAKGYVTRIAQGRFDEAYAMIRNRIPLPSVVGRVCHHPCEAACVRGRIDEPVAICSLKRVPADLAAEYGHLAPQFLPEGERGAAGKVAVVGSGPAGLAAAHDLALRGYAVTVFEAADRPGGMLALGIPAYRLPRDVLAREIQEIADLGVEIRCNQALGRDFQLEDLLAAPKPGQAEAGEQGHAAVFLGLGAGPGLRPPIEGSEAEGVRDAIDFLEQVCAGELESLGGRVLVLGGGDAAVDAARSALRLGADQATVVYRRTRDEMPAHPEEVAAAEAEGVEFRFLGMARRVLTEAGQVQALECQQMELAEADDSGRPRPVPVEGQSFTLQAEHVIVAVGQAPSLGFLAEAGLELSGGGLLAVDAQTGQTSMPGVFAGGDSATGPATVIEAIAAGKRAALGIDLTLSRGEREVRPLSFHEPPDSGWDEVIPPVGVASEPRVAEPALDVEQRLDRGFPEVMPGYTAEQAMAEAARCLDCSPCSLCDNCVENFGCPAIGRHDGRIEIDATLCTGCGICAQLCPNGAIYRVE